MARLVLALGLAAVAGLIAARPGERGAARGAWLALLALSAAASGLAVGALRLAAIDGGAFHGPTGRPTTARGFVTAVPRRSRGQVRVRIQTADGRLAVEASEPVPDLPIGRQVSATGTLRDPQPWEAGYLARHGIRQVLAADRLAAYRPAARRSRGADRSHPRSGGDRPRKRHPGGGGGAPEGLRPGRGRPHRRGHRRRLQALRARPPARRLRPERDPARPAGASDPGAPRRAGPRAPALRSGADRDLRPRHRRRAPRSCAPARWVRQGSSPRSPGGRARAGTRSCSPPSSPWRSTRGPAGTSAGNSASPP